jgi:hypothetical protein
MSEDERKYIDLLQSAISRMASNSFQLKGWSVGLGSVIIGLTAKDSRADLAWLALIPIAAFWLLDAFYLALERLYRKRYVAAVPTLRAAGAPAATLYDMNVGSVSIGIWLKAALSRSVLPLHGALCVVAIAVLRWGPAGHVPKVP